MFGNESCSRRALYGVSFVMLDDFWGELGSDEDGVDGDLLRRVGACRCGCKVAALNRAPPGPASRRSACMISALRKASWRRPTHFDMGGVAGFDAGESEPAVSDSGDDEYDGKSRESLCVRDCIARDRSQ